MLKKTTVYDVSVLLQDNNELTCLLLTPPTADTLRGVAEQEETPTEIVEALAFVREITMPAEDEDEAITPITIAGLEVGSIRVVPLAAFLQTPKRGRKPKSAQTSEAPPEAPPEAPTE